MNKEEFMTELRKNLSSLPQDEAEERISFYEEMIVDHMEDGESEEEAVAALGPMSSITEQILSEIPLTKLVKERIRPKRKLRTWEVVLLLVGSPVWVPLTIALLIVILCVFIVFWTLLVVLCLAAFAVVFTLAACAVGVLFGVTVYLSAGNIAGAVFAIGTVLALAGLVILLFSGSVWLAKNGIRLTGKVTEKALFKIKTTVTRKEITK